MRILVTRPEQAAQRTATRLAQLGHDPVLLPLMVAEHHPDAALASLNQRHAAIAVTSAEAIRTLSFLRNTLSVHFDTQVFAVGEATARAAREIGFYGVQVANGTGASMVAIFGETIKRLTSTAPLLYFAGQPRSPVLEAGLSALKVPVLVCRAYTMHPLPIEPDVVITTIRQQSIDAVLLYSRETALRLFELLSSDNDLEPLLKTPILCLSRNVSEAVPTRLRQNVRTADQPDEDSLLALL